MSARFLNCTLDRVWEDGIQVQVYPGHSSSHSSLPQQQLSSASSTGLWIVPTKASSACSTSTLAASCLSGLAPFALALAASKLNLAFCTARLAFIAKLI